MTPRQVGQKTAGSNSGRFNKKSGHPDHIILEMGRRNGIADPHLHPLTLDTPYIFGLQNRI